MHTVCTVYNNFDVIDSYLDFWLKFNFYCIEKSTGFRYVMNELWAFSCAESRNRIVNAISWNIINVVSVFVQDTG